MIATNLASVGDETAMRRTVERALTQAVMVADRSHPGRFGRLNDVGNLVTDYVRGSDIVFRGKPDTEEQSLTQFLTATASAGWYRGGAITTLADGLIAIAKGEGWLRDDDALDATLYPISWPDTELSLAAYPDQIVYVAITYNGGTPAVVLKPLPTTFNYREEFPIARVLYESAAKQTLISYVPFIVRDHAALDLARTLETVPLARAADTGLVLAPTGVRYVNRTAGKLWAGFYSTVLPTFDSEQNPLDTFARFYVRPRAGGGYEIDFDGHAERQYPTLYWNDTTDAALPLKPIIPGKYANVYWFLGYSGELSMMYGQAEHDTQDEAETEPFPSRGLPLSLGLQAFARFTFRAAADTAASFITYWEIGSYRGAPVTIHGDLAMLDADDHPQYVATFGRQTPLPDGFVGQRIHGGNSDNDELQLKATVAPTQGYIRMLSKTLFTQDVYFSANSFWFGADTADGTDTKRILIGGGGSPSTARGSYISMAGNEFVAGPGAMTLFAGDGREILSYSPHRFRSPIYLDGTTVTYSATPLLIAANTGDGADNKLITIAGGGAATAGRGAFINIYGNEYPTQGGQLDLHAGANKNILAFSTFNPRLGIVFGNNAANDHPYMDARNATTLILHTLKADSSTAFELSPTGVPTSPAFAQFRLYKTDVMADSVNTEFIDWMSTSAGYAFETGQSGTGLHRDIYFRIAGTTILRLTPNNVVVAGNLQYTSTNFTIAADTADGADTKRIVIAGGGTAAQSRGAYISFHGNEYATDPGDLFLNAGGEAGMEIRSQSVHRFVARAYFDSDWVLSRAVNAANGILIEQTVAATPTPRLFFQNTPGGFGSAIYMQSDGSLQFTTGATYNSASGTTRITLLPNGNVTFANQVTMTGASFTNAGFISGSDAYWSVNGTDHVLALNDNGIWEAVGNLNTAARGSTAVYLGTSGGAAAYSFAVARYPSGLAFDVVLPTASTNTLARLYYNASNYLQISVDGTGYTNFSITGSNQTLGLPSIDVNGPLRHRNDFTVLNKAGNGWVTWAIRNTSGAEAVVDLSVGTLTAQSIVGPIPSGSLPANRISAATFGTDTGGGAFTFPENLQVLGALDTGLVQHRSHLQVLNKNANGWVQWATRNTSGTEVVMDLNVGTVIGGTLAGNNLNITSGGVSRFAMSVSGAGGLQIKPTAQATNTNFYWLDVSGTVKASLDMATGNMAVNTLTATSTVTANAGIFIDLRIQHTSPEFDLFKTNAPVDQKNWDIVLGDSTISFRAVNDANTAATNWMIATRSGTTITEVQLATSTTKLVLPNAGYVSLFGHLPTDVGMLFRTSDGTVKGYVFGDAAGFGLLTKTGDWALRVDPNDDVRAIKRFITEGVTFLSNNAGYTNVGVYDAGYGVLRAAIAGYGDVVSFRSQDGGQTFNPIFLVRTAADAITILEATSTTGGSAMQLRVDGTKRFEILAANYISVFSQAASGGLEFRNSSAALKGYLYSDDTGFGLLGDNGGWAVQVSPGNTGVTFHKNALFLGQIAGFNANYQDSATVDIYGSGGDATSPLLRVFYSTNTGNYLAHLSYNSLQLGNNSTNYLVAGRTSTGGALELWTNNTANVYRGAAPDGFRNARFENGRSDFYGSLYLNGAAIGSGLPAGDIAIASPYALTIGTRTDLSPVGVVAQFSSDNLSVLILPTWYRTTTGPAMRPTGQPRAGATPALPLLAVDTLDGGTYIWARKAATGTWVALPLDGPFGLPYTTAATANPTTYTPAADYVFWHRINISTIALTIANANGGNIGQTIIFEYVSTVNCNVTYSAAWRLDGGGNTHTVTANIRFVIGFLKFSATQWVELFRRSTAV